MTARANAQGALQRLLQRLVEAASAAWWHDPLFRGAVIGAGITLALVLLHMVGPHDPALDRPGATLRYVPGMGVQTGSGPDSPSVPRTQALPADVPKIAPGHALSEATIIPTPNTDRFGTFTPGKRP